MNWGDRYTVLPPAELYVLWPGHCVLKVPEQAERCILPEVQSPAEIPEHAPGGSVRDAIPSFPPAAD